MNVHDNERWSLGSGRGKAFVALLTVSAALNIALAHTLAERSTHFRAPGLLGRGSHLPPLHATSADGRAVTLTFAPSQTPTILYLFKAECEWCDVNARSIRALSAAVTGRYRVVGLDVGSADGGAAVVRFPFEVLKNPVESQEFQPRGLPYTCVVTPAAVVQECWKGAFIGEQKASLQRWFGVTLPQLTVSDTN